MIKIEVLYSEYMNLYGDKGNIDYLEQSLEKVKIIYTGVTNKPKFLTNKIDMIYLGPCTENHQEEIVEILRPYKKKIIELIEEGVVVLATGNALEIFAKHIEKTDGKKIEGLGIFNVYAKRESDFRHNELCLGVTLDGFELVGFKNQMSHLYGKEKKHFQDMFLGTGRNKNTDIEGITYKNFTGTYLLGPILPLNPYFAKQIITKLGVNSFKLAFEEDAIKAYEKRLKEFRKLIKN